MRLLRHQVAETSQLLHRAGWCANHDGNVTARLVEGHERGSPTRSRNRYIATPTATSKRLVAEKDLIEVDGKGEVIGRGKVFGEIGLHLAVYERRPDVGAVVHAHPPYATAIGASRGNPIERPFIAEALVSLGPRIPKLPYAQPGEDARRALAPWCELVDAVILGNHGVITWGKDCETALLRLELVEHLAKIAHAAVAFGGIEPLPDAALQPLLAARAKAGLGRAADRALDTAAQLLGSAPGMPASPPRPGASVLSSASSSPPASTGRTPKPVVACAPAPHSEVPVVPPSGGKPHDIAQLVREEIVRALEGS